MFHTPYFHLRRWGSRLAGGFWPNEVADLYGMPKVASSQDVAVAIVELGGGYYKDDLAKAAQQMNVPAPIIVDVPILGAGPTPGDPADGEVALDQQVAMGVYSSRTGKPLTIYMVWVPNNATGFPAAAQTALQLLQQHNVRIMSNSWGSPEDNWGSGIQDLETQIAAYAAAGGLFLSAAGDNGSGDGESGNHADYPASSPNGIGCGGTTWGTPEVVWNDGRGDGTGGGFSAVFPRPAFQAGIPFAVRTLRGGLGSRFSNDPKAAMRMVPDVAGIADPATGYKIFVNGQLGVIGGTSAVSPLWSGFLATLLSAGATVPKQADLMKLFYLSQALFNDITIGNNGTFRAGPGPDPCTGMGTPKGAAILAALTGVGGGGGGGGGGGPVQSGRPFVDQAFQGAFSLTQKWIQRFELAKAEQLVNAWMDQAGW